MWTQTGRLVFEKRWLERVSAREMAELFETTPDYIYTMARKWNLPFRRTGEGHPEWEEYREEIEYAVANGFSLTKLAEGIPGATGSLLWHFAKGRWRSELEPR